jgi:hypothetical protein
MEILNTSQPQKSTPRAIDQSEENEKDTLHSDSVMESREIPELFTAI